MTEIRDILRKFWGYDDFRPLQAEAIQCVTAGRDSVVVLPTGGGKSLCFQAPAMQMPGLAVVVSPLISLMKDQVDGLIDCGVPAAFVNSTSPADERRRVADEIRAGRLKLLYLSPERLMTERMHVFLQQIPLSFFAIDEAHCISEWGHDFRPEYRMLRTLKDSFPGVALHAYTATATPRVRDDISRELRLQDPAILVGSFDRPNLVYRVQRRTDALKQIRGVIDRHRGESGIIYCIRRRDVEETAAALSELGYDALPYHAGMSDVDRRRAQDAFINDRTPIIVATVAFGMGIDKSDVRFVIHAGAPKSLENYQQESGRSGRDGLEAECWLFYSPKDFQTWRMLQKDLPEQALESALNVLAGIERYAIGVTCRHGTILEYFGQELESENCAACDVCLAELDLVDDALVVAQKIISCVLRLEQKFGADHTASVLAGSREDRIISRGHDRLSTWGILSDQDKKAIRGWIEQLAAQGFLQRTGEYNLLQVTRAGRKVLRGEISPRLLRPALRPAKTPKSAEASWEGVDRGLFEALRTLRKRQSDRRGLPPFMIFSDATLRELARRRPSDRSRLLAIHGIAERKCEEYGAELLTEIADYCRKQELAMDAPGRPPKRSVSPSPTGLAKRQAFDLFARGSSIAQVQQIIGRAQSTTVDYLAEFIEQQSISDPSPWLEADLFQRISEVFGRANSDRLKPIFEAMQGAVTYEQIRIAVACIKNVAGDDLHRQAAPSSDAPGMR